LADESAYEVITFEEGDNQEAAEKFPLFYPDTVFA
jgi:hypothetical protein